MEAVVVFVRSDQYSKYSWINFRAARAAVSYTHLTLPTN